jgi:hypothetical protein
MINLHVCRASRAWLKHFISLNPKLPYVLGHVSFSQDNQWNYLHSPWYLNCRDYQGVDGGTRHSRLKKTAWRYPLACSCWVESRWQVHRILAPMGRRCHFIAHCVLAVKLCDDVHIKTAHVMSMSRTIGVLQECAITSTSTWLLQHDFFILYFFGCVHL